MENRRPVYGDPVQVLVVDGANVMGSRPDGWWRDRAGAADRLHTELTGADLGHDEIVLVLEGAARGAQNAGQDSRIRTVHAQASGDDVIVGEARTRVRNGTEVTVVTADRELRDRVAAAGAHTISPSWLLQQLTSSTGPATRAETHRPD